MGLWDGLPAHKQNRLADAAGRERASSSDAVSAQLNGQSASNRQPKDFHRKISFGRRILPLHGHLV
jgi:hypothetical protein